MSSDVSSISPIGCASTQAPQSYAPAPLQQVNHDPATSLQCLDDLNKQIKRICAECLTNPMQFRDLYSQAQSALSDMQAIQIDADINRKAELPQMQDLVTKASAIVTLMPNLKEEGGVVEADEKESASDDALAPASTALIKKEGSQAVEIYTGDLQIIFQAAIGFFKHDDLSSLAGAIEALDELEKKRLSMRSASNETTEIDRAIKKCNAVVQMMNFQSPVATKQDVKNILSFFNPPQQLTYFDEKNRVTYIQGDHSQITRIIGAAISGGRYCGMGVLRHLILRHEVTRIPTVCDVVTLLKPDDQIYFETVERNPEKWSLKGMLAGKSYDDTQRIMAQCTAAGEMRDLVRSHLKDWKYASCDFADTTKLVETYGYSFDEAVKTHAIILFYQPLKEAGTS